MLECYFLSSSQDMSPPRNWNATQCVRRSQSRRGSELELQPQCQLSGAISTIIGGLGGLQDPEGARVAHIRSGRRKVRVVKDIIKSGFERPSHTFVHFGHLWLS